jgi:hypothetical protein
MRAAKILATAAANPGSTQATIAKLAETDEAYVSRVLHKYGIKLDSVRDAEKAQPYLETVIKDKVLKILHERDMKKESTAQLTTVFGVFEDKKLARIGKDPNNRPTVRINVHFEGIELPAVKTVDITPEVDEMDK